ncbi:MAG TPA: hypothetical protein VF047_00955 [Nitrososphaeraceae archaeon]
MKRLNVGNHDHNKNKVDWEQYNTFHKTFMESGSKGRPRISELRYDQKFVEICKDIGFAPKYQYQLMQLVTQIQPEILKLAETLPSSATFF